VFVNCLLMVGNHGQPTVCKQVWPKSANNVCGTCPKIDFAGSWWHCQRSTVGYLNSYSKENAPFYIVSLYIVVFWNATPKLIGAYVIKLNSKREKWHCKE
jgi:hypothetical protein